MDADTTGLVTRSPALLSIERAILIVVDVQEKLFPLITDHKKIGWNIGRLLQGVSILEVPVLATEQYPQGLGPTTPELSQLIQKCQTEYSSGNSASSIPSKLSFSCCGSENFSIQLSSAKRDQIILTGIETHVCVLQTAYDLLSQGYHVHLVVDAIGSRNIVDRDTAIRRLESEGVTLTTTETVLFELCERAGTPTFKQISQLVRQTEPA